MIDEFETAQEHHDSKAQSLHHDQNESTQKTFDKNVRSLVSVIEELGNLYLEETTDLLVLDTKDIESVSVIHSVQNVQKVGKEALESFVKERLIERKKPLVDDVPRIYEVVPLFGNSSAKDQSAEKQKVASLKSDVQLFSRLYIACQTRDGNLDDFSVMKINPTLHLCPRQGSFDMVQRVIFWIALRILHRLVHSIQR